MIYTALPDDKQHRLPFYLAMEEYIARSLPADDYFFMWQVEPTVIFGRNQLINAEIDIDYCRNNNIQMYRRKSGGGCVYADKSNIMLSYITPNSNVNFTFNKYMLMVEHVLQKLGIDAKSTGRNDILIDGKKVSGNAFYHLPERSIVHGTMLYDTDVEKMALSTTPSDAKLKSKGVESVRQHVTTLNKYINLSIDDFKHHVRHNLCTDTITLDEKAVQTIKAIEQEYLSDEFIYGRNPAYTVIQHERIEGVGEFDMRIEVKNNTIRKMNILGDYFPVGDIDHGLLRYFEGIPYNADAMLAAIENIIPENIIMNLRKEQLNNLIKKLF